MWSRRTLKRFWGCKTCIPPGTVKPTTMDKRFLIVIPLLLWSCATGTGGTCQYTELELPGEITPLLPPGWKISAVETGFYPHNHTRSGPTGMRLSIIGEPRTVRLYIEDSKNSYIRRTMPVKPLYYVYVMPKTYRGVPVDRNRMQRDGEGFYAREIGSDRCRRFYLYYYFELSCPRPGLSFRTLGALLTKIFNLKYIRN